MSKYKRDVKSFVLDRADIVDLIGQYVSLKRAGRSHKGLCPFHSEKTPSFVVSEERGNFHCFGCGAGGDAISFVMQKENLGFIDALEFLADKYHLDLSSYLEEDNRRREADTKPLYEVMRLAALFYYKQLGGADYAIQYLKGRQISPSLLKSFGVGYAPQGWDNLIRHLKAQGVTEQTMLQAGLIIMKDGGGCYDRFRHRIIFPIFDYRSRVVAFGGRVLDDSHPKYLNSPETPIFNKSRTLYGLHVAKKHPNNKRQVLLVEGYMDVISLHQFGFQNAVATLGTALTESHAKELKKLCDEVIFAYDADEAGQNAIARSLDVLKGAGLRVKIIDMDTAKDPDEYLKKFGKDSFLEIIERAMNTIDFSLKRLETGYNLKDDEQRLQYLGEAYQLIGALASKAEQDVYLENLSRRTGIHAQALHEDFSARKVIQQVGKENQKPLQTREQTEIEDIAFDAIPIDEEMLSDLMESIPADFLDNYGGMPKDFTKNTQTAPASLLIIDPKLATIEKALLKCALLSKPYYMRVREQLLWGFYDPLHHVYFEAIGSFYSEFDAFDPVSAASFLSLDIVTRLQSFNDDSAHVGSVSDVDKLIRFHHKHFCEVQIKAVDQELQALKLTPGDQAQIQYRKKMVERANLSKELALAVKTMQGNG